MTAPRDYPPILEELPQRHSLRFWDRARTALVMALAVFVLCVLLPGIFYILA